MARQKRSFTTFNLSFLDIMSCGFGAVVLVFLIIDHSIEVQSKELNRDLLSEVNLLEEDIAEGEKDRVRLRNTLSDVDLAFASEAVVLGFNVTPSDAVAAAAKRCGVDVRSYRVIYDLVDDLRAAMEGRLAAVDERTPIGRAVVKAVFGGGARRVAGCAVEDGVLRKGCLAVVTRRKRVVAEGALTSLRRVKDDVAEVGAGVECGVGVAGFSDWAEGDVIDAFSVEQKQRTLEEASADVVPLTPAASEPAAV